MADLGGAESAHCSVPTRALCGLQGWTHPRSGVCLSHVQGLVISRFYPPTPGGKGTTQTLEKIVCKMKNFARAVPKTKDRKLYPTENEVVEPN